MGGIQEDSTINTVEKCKIVCLGKPSCVGFDFDTINNQCWIHDKPLERNPAPGIDLYIRKRPGTDFLFNAPFCLSLARGVCKPTQATDKKCEAEVTSLLRVFYQQMQIVQALAARPCALTHWTLQSRLNVLARIDPQDKSGSVPCVSIYMHASSPNRPQRSQLARIERSTNHFFVL